MEDLSPKFISGLVVYNFANRAESLLPEREKRLVKKQFFFQFRKLTKIFLLVEILSFQIVALDTLTAILKPLPKLAGQKSETSLFQIRNEKKNISFFQTKAFTSDCSSTLRFY